MASAEKRVLSFAEEQRYRLLVESIIDYAVYMLDPNGIIVTWNPGAQRFKGYDAEEVIGTHFSRFYVPKDRAQGLPEKALATAAERGRFEAEGWRVRKDGTRFWTHVIIDPVRNPDGDLVGFAKITRDITERMNAQRELEEAREALFQSQKMEAIGQLTGGVAHDFNNLLMVILSSLDLLQRRVPPDRRVMRLIENAQQATRRGATLTQRMLTFARRQRLTRTAVDIPELVEEMSDLIQSSLGPMVHIKICFPPDLPQVNTDANQLETAILNLALNARDAMPEGGVVTLAAREAIVAAGDRANLKPGRYVCLSIEDCGEGMDDETLARALEPFFTTKGVGKGTGLGLPMAQGLAEQSGGQLYLSSVKGRGTKIEMWLPAAAADAPVADATSAADVASAEPRRLHVLIVDDDPLVLANTVAMLEDLGHEAFATESASAAMEKLRSGDRVDLVITDQAMPGMRGDQLAVAIHAEMPDLPVVLASGYNEVANGSGVHLPQLPKPFDQKQLAEMIARVMSVT